MNTESSWVEVIDQENLIAEIQKTRESSLKHKEKLLQTLTSSDSGQQALHDQLTAKKEELANGAQSAFNFDTDNQALRHEYKEKNNTYLLKMRDFKRKESKKNGVVFDLTNLKEHLTERSKT